MGRNIFILIFILFSCVSLAQTQKGKFLVEGGSNLEGVLSNESYDNGTGPQKTNNSQLVLQMGLGYFILKNFVIGEGSTWSFYTTKDNSTGDKTKSTNISVGPLLRYYVGQSKVKPLVQANIAWLSSNIAYISAGLNSTTKSSGILYSGGIGVAYFLNDYVSFNGIVGYSNSSQTTTDNNNNKTKQTVGGFNININVTVCF